MNRIMNKHGKSILNFNYVKFYFQDSNQKWIQKTNSNNIRLSKFNDESKEMFFREKILKFEINPPS